jgi:hypothetical protein
MSHTHTRSFTLGAIAGTVFGATVFGLIAHFLVLGLVVAGAGVAALHLGRRAVLVSCVLSSWLKYGMLCHGTNWTSQAGVGVE